MFLRSFLLGATALALPSSAVLVLPETQGIAPEDGISALSPLEAQSTQQQLIQLSCTECPFREVDGDGQVSWSDGFKTSLSLNFSVDDGLLLANGHQVFPPPPPTTINAVQRRESDGEESDPIPLGYALEIMPLPTPPEEEVELLEIRFTILDLDSHPVPLDTVAISLIHDRDGSIYMAKTDVEETAPNRVSWKQCRGKPSCLRKLLFDRMRDLFAAAKTRMLGMKSRLAGPKGCHGRPPFPRPMHHGPHHHHGDGAWAEGGPLHAGNHLRPSPPPHMHHFHHGGLNRTISRIFRFIVVPAVLGVLAGLLASALGMLFGQVVIFFWLRYRRSGNKQATANLEQGTASEKQGLMEESDDIPPAYVDEGVHVLDEKQ